MKSNFDFLQPYWPVLANFGSLAEQYCYTDANSSIMKVGMIGETIVNLIYLEDKISYPYDNSANTRIDKLQTEDFITNDLADILHALRKARNKAVHQNFSSVDTAKALLQMAYSLCEWFMETYGDYTYQHKDFVMPIPSSASVPPADKTAEEKKENELIKEAENEAEQKEKADPKERKKKAKRAAGNRVKTEAETRYMIDEQLRKVGWEADTPVLRYSKGTRPMKGRNLAIAEWPTDSDDGGKGFADYALFIGLKMVATVEAKASHKDIPSVLDVQCRDYSSHIRQEDASYVISNWGAYQVPFTFATNGRPYLMQLETKSGIWSLDLRDPSNAPKALHGWISPEGMEALLSKDITSSNQQLSEMSYDLLREPDGLSLRDYQIKAIEAAEKSIIAGRKNVLLAMATGTGKTRTILGMIYRFLKTNRFRRILFLVDRNTLGEQATGVFKEVKLENLLTLDNIYNIKGLDEKEVDKETRIHVATVQSMVKRILYNDDDTMPSVTDYDLVIIDEAHRGYTLDREMGEEELLYRDEMDYQSKYRSVIEYFDAVHIALTATPALHTTQIFGAPVYKYTYREAVIDGYLVDHDAPIEIKTKLSTEGIHYKKGDKVLYFDPLTRNIINSEVVEDELDFDVDDFNKSIINEDFNLKVLQEISQYIDPENPGQDGKTLIYAVNDAHADMIVTILKKIYGDLGVDTRAIMKITGAAGGGDRKRIEEIVKRFKNEDYPSIAVTVDLLTTGIDVPEITNLVFLRRVKSRILFEQMLGRATRLCPRINKAYFRIFDPVGTYESIEEVNTMKPVVANPTTSVTKLVEELADIDDEKQIEYQVCQIIAKLQRSRKVMTPGALEKFMALTGGKDLKAVLDDIMPNHLLSEQGPDDASPDADPAAPPASIAQDPKELKAKVLKYTDALRFMDNPLNFFKKPVYISDKEDEVISVEPAYPNNVKPEDYLESFETFIRTNLNEIAALNIICTRPKDLTRESLKSLRLTLDMNGFTTQQLNTAVSSMTNQDITADIISLIRRYAIGSALISHEAKVRNAVAKLKKAHSFSKLELNWINRIEQYLLNESVINDDTFDQDSRFQSAGGYTKINKVFQNNLSSIISELNEYLYDDGGRTA